MLTSTDGQDRQSSGLMVLSVVATLLLAACAGTDGSQSEPAAPTPATGLSPAPQSAPATQIGGPDGGGSDLVNPRPVPDNRDPAARAGAAAQRLDCDGAVHQGGWWQDFAVPVAAPGPLEALREFDVEYFFSLESHAMRGDNWQEAATEPGRILYTHDVDGRSKAATIVADASVVAEESPVADGWVVETFASCHPDELGIWDIMPQPRIPELWTDQDGQRMPRSVVTSRQGPEHCGWQSTTVLELDDERRYVRDPQDIHEDRTVVAYDGDADVPDDAVDTGYRRHGDELWLSADETVAYVVTSDTVEAWPWDQDLVGCE